MGNFPTGHMSEWPAGRYHKAHYHGPGAILLGLRGGGYVLLWHKSLGHHPYADGHGDQVVKIEWGPRSIYSPSDGWYHQHFNTGDEPARHVAIHVSGGATRQEPTIEGEPVLLTGTSEGGSLIDYEEEDPEVRRHFEETLKKKGIKSAMPPVTYR